MNSETFSKMIVLIAAGLYEKEQNKYDRIYPYSNKLIHGMESVCGRVCKKQSQLFGTDIRLT